MNNQRQAEDVDFEEPVDAVSEYGFAFTPPGDNEEEEVECRKKRRSPGF